MGSRANHTGSVAMLFRPTGTNAVLPIGIQPLIAARFYGESAGSPPATSSRGLHVVTIRTLETKHLLFPLDIIVEPDEDAWIAKCPDVPSLYGFGELASEAVEMLKREIESMHEDLNQAKMLPDRLVRERDFLNTAVA